MATEVGEPAKAVVEQTGVAEPNGEPPATTAATETAPEKTTEGAAAPKPPPVPKQGIAYAITAWATASLTFLKAVLALIVAVVLVVATVRIFWRSYGQKQVTIEVAPEATKVIAQMGIDFDLRSMLVAAVGQKIEAVQTIVKLQDLVIVDGDQTIDLKAVGVDVKSEDLRGVLQNILGPPPVYHVRLGVICSDGACGGTSTPSAAAGSITAPREVSLIVDMKDRNSDERIVRRISWPNPGLRHELRAAVDDLADRILLKANRQAASVLFLNVGPAMEFREDGIDYESRAAAAAFDKAPHDDCLARNVYAVSLWLLGDPESAALILEGTGREKNATSRCRVHSETNLSTVRTSQAFGESDRAAADLRFKQASAALDNLTGASMAASEHLRVGAFRTGLDLARVDDALRRGSDPPSTEDARSAYSRLSEVLARAEQDLPPAADHVFSHQIIDQAVGIVARTSPVAAAPERVRVILKLLGTVERCLAHTTAPRRLLLARGILERSLAVTLLEATRAPEETQAAIQRALHDEGAGVFPVDTPPAMQWWQARTAALVAFQAATKARAFPFPLERASEVEPSAAMADVHFLFNEDAEAVPALYARAVRAFVEQDMPSSDIHLVALTVAKWAIWSLRNQRCVGPLAEPPAPVLSSLGLKGEGLCSLARARSRQSASDERGIWGIIHGQALDAVQECASPPGASKLRFPLDRNWAVFQCLQERYRTWLTQQPLDSSAAVDRKIEEIDQ